MFAVLFMVATPIEKSIQRRSGTTVKFTIGLLFLAVYELAVSMLFEPSKELIQKKVASNAANHPYRVSAQFELGLTCEKSRNVEQKSLRPAGRRAFGFIKSGRLDSNQRPPETHSGGTGPAKYLLYRQVRPVRPRPGAERLAHQPRKRTAAG